MEDRLFDTQKYFIFKLADILNNSFHIFEEKRSESLQFILKLCLDTYEEMHNTQIGMDKLEKSYKALLSSLVYQLKKHSYKNLSLFRVDFERLCLIISCYDEKRNQAEINMSIRSLEKKINNQNLCKLYVDCLKTEMSFQRVDNLIETLISDLLFMGYSHNYLTEWYKNNMQNDEFYQDLNKKNIFSYIEKLEELNGEKSNYEVIIPYDVKNEQQKLRANKLLEKNLQ